MKKSALLVQSLLKMLSGLLLMGLVLFLPAGTWHYPGGWLRRGRRRRRRGWRGRRGWAGRQLCPESGDSGGRVIFIFQLGTGHHDDHQHQGKQSEQDGLENFLHRTSYLIINKAYLL